MVSGDVGKKIHVELKFLRLEFHHFISLLLPCVCSCSVFFFVAGVLLRLSTQRSSPSKSPSVVGVLHHRFTQCSSPARSPTQCLFVLSSDLLWVLLFFSDLLFFFGFFLLFLGLYVLCSLFEIECKKLEIHFFLNSTIKNSRSMWHNHAQLSKLSKWEASFWGSRLIWNSSF